MADTWNAVEARLYKERRLSKLARLQLAFVVASCANQYGIYDPSPEGDTTEWFEGMFDRAAVLAAFDEIINTGIAVRFRDADCLWLVKKFRRSLAVNTVSSYKHLQGVANELARYPEISGKFWELYGIPLAEIAKGFPDKPNPLAIFANNNIPINPIPINEIPLAAADATDALEIPADATSEEQAILLLLTAWKWKEPRGKPRRTSVMLLDGIRKAGEKFPLVDHVFQAELATAWLDEHPRRHGNLRYWLGWLEKAPMRMSSAFTDRQDAERRRKATLAQVLADDPPPVVSGDPATFRERFKLGGFGAALAGDKRVEVVE